MALHPASPRSRFRKILATPWGEDLQTTLASFWKPARNRQCLQAHQLCPFQLKSFRQEAPTAYEASCQLRCCALQGVSGELAASHASGYFAIRYVDHSYAWPSAMTATSMLRQAPLGMAHRTNIGSFDLHRLLNLCSDVLSMTSNMAEMPPSSGALFRKPQYPEKWPPPQSALAMLATEER